MAKVDVKGFACKYFLYKQVDVQIFPTFLNVKIPHLSLNYVNRKQNIDLIYLSTLIYSNIELPDKFLVRGEDFSLEELKRFVEDFVQAIARIT